MSTSPREIRHGNGKGTGGERAALAVAAGLCADRAERAARYALQMVARCPQLHVCFEDNEFLCQLWTLSYPLFDPQKLVELNEDWNRPSTEDEQRAADDPPFEELEFFLNDDVVEQLTKGKLLTGIPGVRMRDYLIARFTALPEALLEALAKADGVAATHVSVGLLAECIGLSEAEARVLDFVEKKDSVAPFRRLLREAGGHGTKHHVAFVAAALDVTPAQLHLAISRHGILARLELLQRSSLRSDLEDFLKSNDLLEDLLGREPATREELLAVLVEAAVAVECGIADFPHLAREAARLTTALSQAAATRTPGVNALLYGPPGSGKTQFASAVAQAAGLQAFQVRAADEDGDGLSRAGRMGAYKLMQRLLSGRKDCVVIFDEIEDVFASADQALAMLFADRAPAGRDKGWMNRTLEENLLPSIWITNDVDCMDAAFLRRFLLPVAFTVAPRRVRRSMALRHLGDTAVSGELIDELAADPVLMPGHFGAARRLLDLQPQGCPDTVVREGVAAARRLLHGTGLAPLRRPAIAFDVAYLNLAGGIAPGRLAEALARSGRGALCFYGPPGTGKTEFAHVLADALDRELVVKASSDLVSAYVGETERNIARLFNELDAEHSVLLLDEVDSLLRDRGQAQRSWELTQVNELLQQMERFNGIFIAATNLMTELDAAAMRRFDFKLEFRPLTEAQRLALFAREALGDANAIDAIPAPLARRLASMPTLTPGDFANVVRQRALLGEVLSAEEFLRRLIVECRYKGGVRAAA